MKDIGKALKRLAVSGLAMASMAGASGALAGDQAAMDAAIAQLREGGNVIVLRHATSPGDQKAAIGMTEGCELAPGRGLSPQGFYEARFIGGFLADHGVTIDRTYTSNLCRAFDTARLVAAAGSGPVIPRDEMKSDDEATAAAFRASLAAELAAAPGSNILLVSHSNITPLYWSGPLAGEEETPSGRVHVISFAALQKDATDEVIRLDVTGGMTAPDLVLVGPADDR